MSGRDVAEAAQVFGPKLPCASLVMCRGPAREAVVCGKCSGASQGKGRLGKRIEHSNRSANLDIQLAWRNYAPSGSAS